MTAFPKENGETQGKLGMECLIFAMIFKLGTAEDESLPTYGPRLTFSSIQCLRSRENAKERRWCLTSSSSPCPTEEERHSQSGQYKAHCEGAQTRAGEQVELTGPEI